MPFFAQFKFKIKQAFEEKTHAFCLFVELFSWARMAICQVNHHFR